MTEGPPADLVELLTIERIEHNLFRAGCVFDEPYALYGGQVAAQALMAAGSTVAPGRFVHSLHGYFLRAGDASRPTVFQVHRDRDGRSFSARRVVAIQSGKVIFNMSASFHIGEGEDAEQTTTAPQVTPPESLPEYEFRRLASFEGRIPPQPYAERMAWPTRFWARCTADLPDDPLLHAAVLTYLSDVSTGVLAAADGTRSPSSSLDHALWFHRIPSMQGWTLSEYEPRFTGHGRGWYTGSIFTQGGQLLASLAQECLFRAPG